MFAQFRSSDNQACRWFYSQWDILFNELFKILSMVDRFSLKGIMLTHQ